MAIEYRIILDDEHEFSYRIEPDRGYDEDAARLARSGRGWITSNAAIAR